MVRRTHHESFPPLGRCMYCGRNDVGLSCEHIIPYGLGGNLTMRDSSCKECADITKEIEQQCLRPMFGALRIRQDYQTNNPKERPTHLKVRIGRSVEDRWHAQGEIEVPVEDVPVFLVLPVPLPPTILTKMEAKPLSLWHHINEKELDAFREKYGGGFGHSKLMPLTFFRLLAKIAHGYAIGSLGYGAFEPLLCNLIRGTNETATDLVGISPEQPKQEDVFCYLHMRKCETDGVVYFGVNVCLFMDLGAPTYLVVAGKKI